MEFVVYPTSRSGGWSPKTYGKDDDTDVATEFAKNMSEIVIPAKDPSAVTPTVEYAFLLGSARAGENLNVSATSGWVSTQYSSPHHMGHDSKYQGTLLEHGGARNRRK